MLALTQEKKSGALSCASPLQLPLWLTYSMV
jgi:hypothetical protein